MVVNIQLFTSINRNEPVLSIKSLFMSSIAQAEDPDGKFPSSGSYRCSCGVVVYRCILGYHGNCCVSCQELCSNVCL